ncbi:hypothetical protein MNBD_PLANCTO02-12, partial [hydrothermal vent metagenome]
MMGTYMLWKNGTCFSGGWILSATFLLMGVIGCHTDETQTPSLEKQDQQTTHDQNENSPIIDHHKINVDESNTPQKNLVSQATPQKHPLPLSGKGYKKLVNRVSQSAPPELVKFIEENRVAGQANQAKATQRVIAWRREQVKDFTATDMLAAAREAGLLSLQEGFPLTDPVDQLGRTSGEIWMCLRDYPLKFKGDEGVEPLLVVIRDRTDDWYLRHYLISQIGFSQQSQPKTIASVEDYLSRYANQHQTKIQKMLRTITKDPLDNPLVRAASVEPKRDWLIRRLKTILNSDPNVIAYRRKHFTPINGSSSEDNSIVKKSTPNTPTPPSKASSNS